MMRHKINPFCRLQKKVVETFGQSTSYEPTNQNSIKVPKVVKPTNTKMLLKKLFGPVQCSLINNPVNPSSLNKIEWKWNINDENVKMFYSSVNDIELYF